MIRGALSAGLASVTATPAGVAPAFSACGVAFSASASSACISVIACWRAASFSNSGPTTKTCQPKSTAIERLMARIMLRFSGFINHVPVRLYARIHMHQILKQAFSRRAGLPRQRHPVPRAAPDQMPASPTDDSARYVLAQRFHRARGHDAAMPRLHIQNRLANAGNWHPITVK